MKNMIIFKAVVEDSHILIPVSSFNLLQYLFSLEIYEINLASNWCIVGKESGAK